MALKSAYEHVRNNIDNSFDQYVADNVSYGCEEGIEDLKRWMSEEGTGCDGVAGWDVW